MIVEPKVKKLFPRLPRFEPVFQDSTAMREFKTCKRRYFYRFVLGKVPKHDDKQHVLDFGSAYHTFRENLEIEYQKNPDISMQFVIFKNSLTQALDKYNPKIDPSRKKDINLYNKDRLMKCCTVAFQWWQKEKLDNKIHVIGIEQPINVELPDGSAIAGRADQVIKWNGRLWDRDFKTTTKAINMFKKTIDPHDQGTRYIYIFGALHGEPVGGVVYEVMKNIEGKPPEIENVLLQKTKAQLLMWETEQMIHNKFLNICREEDVWPMTDEGYNCQWCKYQDVCKSPNELAMAQKLGMNYDTKPWRMENVQQEVIK